MDIQREDNQFEQLYFSEIKIGQIKKDNRTEAFASLDIKLPQFPGTHKLNVKVDTGVEGNTLPFRMFRQMFPRYMDSKGHPTSNIVTESCTTLTAYNGSRIEQYGVTSINCRHNNGPWSDTRFYIVESEGPAINELPSSRDLSLATLHCHIKTDSDPGTPQPRKESNHPSDHRSINSTAKLVDMYPHQFDQISNFKGAYKIAIDPDAQSVIHAPRRCPIHIKDELQQELESMIQQGVIRKVTEPTDWVNSLTYARKANGKLCLCLDPKHLNAAIKRCHHSTPPVEDITHKFAGAKYFSKLDAKNGYWSVTLDPKSQLLTTFNSPFSRHCFMRRPFGLAMSQDVFQQKMDQILERCSGTVGIVDDVAVYGQTRREHDANLHNLRRVAAEEGLTFNSGKCSICQEKIHFFGTVYNAKGAHLDPKKVEAIHALHSPTSMTELQEILGIITYMSPFIPRLSDLTQPLRELLRTNTDFIWNRSHERALQKVKNVICIEVTLTYFDLAAETAIQVDAAQKGIGAALTQNDRPLTFTSKSLTPTEQRYANIERELVAAVFGCERFHMYVYGKPFIIESDYKPLKMISLKNLTATPPRLQRMLLRLQGYNFTLKYKAGKEMLIADSLSHQPSHKNSQMIHLDIRVDFVQFSPVKLGKIQAETNADGVLTALREIVMSGWPES